jgi:hypothetical protein
MGMTFCPMMARVSPRNHDAVVVAHNHRMNVYGYPTLDTTAKLGQRTRWRSSEEVCFEARPIPLFDCLSRFAYYQFRLDDNLLPEPLSSMNPVQDALCRHPSHVGQWMADGREPGVIERRRREVDAVPTLVIDDIRAQLTLFLQESGT